MTQEEKELLLKDLCARLPYGVKSYPIVISKPETIGGHRKVLDDFYVEVVGRWVPISMIKPYLRPMSSMTEEERDYIEEISHGWFYVNEEGEIYPIGQLSDSGEFEDAILPTFEWLNAHHFDYRGLIEKGLALEAPEGMYK